MLFSHLVHRTTAPTQSPKTASPTNNPSVQPTLSPSQSTSIPTNTPSPTLGEVYVYVRKTGCDVGICSSWNINYENDVCINKLQLLSPNEQEKCCTNSTIRRRRNLLSTSPSKNLTINHAMEPTFVPIEDPIIVVL